MKYLMIMALVGLAACAQFSTVEKFFVEFNEKKYPARTYSAEGQGYYSLRGQAVLKGSYSEVFVNGQWYECVSSCEATVRRVLFDNLPNVQKPQDTLPAQPKVRLEGYGEGGEGGEGGGGSGHN